MSTACFLPYVGIGSCLLHLPYIREFAKRDGPITILTFSKSLVNAIEFDQDIKKVIVIEKYNKKLLDIFKLSNYLKKLQIEKIFIFKSSLRFYFAAKWAGIYTKSYPFYKKKNLHLIKEAQKFTIKNLKLKNCPTETRLHLDKEILSNTKKIIGTENKKILIAPASSGLTTMWKTHYFVELMKKMEAKFNCFFIIAVDSSEREQKIANEITKNFKREKIILLSDKSIGQTMPFIASCEIAICNDTSFQHLSCLLNVPTIILKFDTPSAYTSYSILQHSILPEGYLEVNHDTRADPNLIRVDKVFAKVQELIN